eukprot:m.318995 g.318995  ORF g.318995 m.318995 type:complete len:398 (+) comp19701_c0_seq1:193-1386(+)
MDEQQSSMGVAASSDASLCHDGNSGDINGGAAHVGHVASPGGCQAADTLRRSQWMSGAIPTPHPDVHTADVRCRRSVDCWLQRDYERAHALALGVLQEDPLHVCALLVLRYVLRDHPKLTPVPQPTELDCCLLVRAQRCSVHKQRHAEALLRQWVVHYEDKCSLFLLASLVDAVQGQIEEGAQFYIQAADEGWPAAQFNLAVCYAHGEGVPKDMDRALELYSAAAKQDYPPAIFNLGVCYRNGRGVDRDVKVAAQYYQRAADLGFAHAMNNLGVCYQEGEGVPVNPAKAAVLYQEAASLGYGMAQSNYAWCLRNGRGTERDLAAAVRVYKLAADQGNVTAQNNLASLYEDGTGVNRDLGEAARLYRLAAEKQSATAHFTLRRMGIVVPLAAAEAASP